MHDIYQHILDAEPLSLWITQYIERAQGLYESSLAKRTDGGWQVKGLNKLRTIRIDPEMGWPDLSKSYGVAGVRDLEQGRYIALSDEQAVVYLQEQRDSAPSLEQANIPLQYWQYVNNKKINFSFHGEFSLAFTVRFTGDCYVRFNGQQYHADSTQDLHNFYIPYKKISNAELICK